MFKTIKWSKSKIYAFAEVLPYSLIPLIWIGVSLGFNETGLGSDIARASIVTFAKDIISAFVYLGIVAIKGKFKEISKLLVSKAGMFAIVAGIFGGPIGYTLFNAAFMFAGAAYGHIFTSVEPILLLIMGILIFKRKYKWQVWIGVAITVIAISCLVFGSSWSEDGNEVWKIFVGAALGIGGAGAWAVETMLFDKAFDYMDPEKDNENDYTINLLTIKMVSASLFSLTIMFPVLSSIVTGDASKGYESFGSIFTNMDYFWRFILAGTLIMIGRYMYFYAIKEEGGSFVAIVYNLTIVVTPILVIMWYWISGNDLEHKDFQQWLTIGLTSPFIVIGITIVTLYKTEITRELVTEDK